MAAKTLLAAVLIIVTQALSTPGHPQSYKDYTEGMPEGWRLGEEIATMKLNNSSDISWMFLVKSFNLTNRDLELSYQTIWSNGTRTVTLIRANNEPVEETTLKTDGTAGTKRDSVSKRHRKLPASRKAQKFPHSAACKLSCGRSCTWSCSGILIGSSHVLTSAHCVHERDTASLEVGFLQQNGRLQWYDVLKATIPLRWPKEKDMVDDYAVLKLRRQPNRPHLGVVSLTLTKGTMVSITGKVLFDDGRILVPRASGSLSRRSLSTSTRACGRECHGRFPGDKAHTSLWTSKCPVLMVKYGLIWNKCDAAPGSSGSGMFTKIDTGLTSSYAVVGVFSGIRTVTRQGQRKPGSIRVRYNVAVLLTRAKVSQINEWKRL